MTSLSRFPGADPKVQPHSELPRLPAAVENDPVQKQRYHTLLYLLDTDHLHSGHQRDLHPQPQESDFGGD